VAVGQFVWSSQGGAAGLLITAQIKSPL